MGDNYERAILLNLLAVVIFGATGGWCSVAGVIFHLICLLCVVRMDEGNDKSIFDATEEVKRRKKALKL